jgi:hypothetical protein
VIPSLVCMVGPPSSDLPLSEDQPRIKPIPYVGISVMPDSHSLTLSPHTSIVFLRNERGKTNA